MDLWHCRRPAPVRIQMQFPAPRHPALNIRAYHSPRDATPDLIVYFRGWIITRSPRAVPSQMALPIFNVVVAIPKMPLIPLLRRTPVTANVLGSTRAATKPTSQMGCEKQVVTHSSPPGM